MKERMQIQRVPKPNAPVASPAHGGVYYRNGWHALRSIVQTEGVLGLYRVRVKPRMRACGPVVALRRVHEPTYPTPPGLRCDAPVIWPFLCPILHAARRGSSWYLW